MQTHNNARFLLGAHLQDLTADLLTFTFQRDVFGENLYSLQVPRQLLQQLGRQGLIEYVADYYLELEPAEAARLGRSTVIFALTYSF